MEFKFRAEDEPALTPKQTSYPPPPPLPTVTPFTHQPLRGGFSGTVPSPMPSAFRIPVNNANAGAGEALRRELEKAQIRREIIAAEVARRLELEEEVRRELALERRWGTTVHKNLGGPAAAPPHHGFLFEERMVMRLDHGVPKPQLPLLSAPVEVEVLEPFPKNNEDKVIMLVSV